MSNVVWQKSDKYAAFMLLWLIAACVATSSAWFSIIACVLSLVYGIMGFFCTFKEAKEKRN